jgi:hypothetical protein
MPMPKVTAFDAKTRELQQRIRRRSKSKLTDREVRAAIEHGRL